MQSPFVWQFQFELEKIPFWHHGEGGSAASSMAYNFEQRFFWPASEPIILSGLSQQQLMLSSYELEFKKDSYLLLDENRNIKYRKKKLHYKPFIRQERGCCVFAKKQKYHLFQQQNDIMNLLNCQAVSGLSTKNQVKEWLCNAFQVCEVEKESLKLMLPIKDTSIEMSRIQINSMIFHSLVVESCSAKQVNECVSALGINHSSQDYVSFLRGVG